MFRHPGPGYMCLYIPNVSIAARTHMLIQQSYALHICAPIYTVLKHYDSDAIAHLMACGNFEHVSMSPLK